MKILLIVMTVIGAGAGLGAGHMLASTGGDVEHAIDETTEEQQHDQNVDAMLAKHELEEESAQDSDFVRLNNQFVVPIVEKERVASLIVVSLALETNPGSTDQVFEREPKLRDEFLTVLFAHARSGGFTGSFTDEHLMLDLRQSLLEAAQKVLGSSIRKVLLSEVVRQDL